LGIDLRIRRFLSYYEEKQRLHLAMMLTPVENFQKYTLDQFLEDATEQVEKEKRRVYCDILISYPNVFDSLPVIFGYYSDRKRSRWTVNISQCAEEDSYLLSFFPKEGTIEENQVFFFWKILRDEKYVTILSFSLQSSAEIHRSLDSLLNFTKGLWFAWLGSRFLETLDLFAVRELGEDAQVLASFQTAIEKDKLMPRKVRAYPLPPREFVSLEEIRKWAKEKYVKEGEIRTFSNMRYRVISEEKGMNFTFSITDRSRITFERGDFTLFATLLRPLLAETRRILDVLRRHSYTTKRESTVLGRSMEIRTFDKIESLVFRRSKETEKWYDSIIELFSSDIPQKKLINFTLLSGNPYFLVHVVDVENSSSVYLSATSGELQIVPAESSTKEGTIAKIIDLLQTKVDPSISV
jgi:hypothetical protein